MPSSKSALRTTESTPGTTDEEDLAKKRWIWVTLAKLNSDRKRAK